MPKYIDNAQNRRLKRVGMGYGKLCSPCEVKKNKKQLIKNKGRPTKPVKKKEPFIKRAEIRKIEPLPLSDRKTVIDLRVKKTQKTNTDIERFLGDHNYKTQAQATKFKHIYDAYKEQKTMNRVNGKSVKFSIRGNTITIKYGYLMVDDMYSDPPKFTDTKSKFVFEAPFAGIKSKKTESTKTEQLRNVKTPLDITKSAKIKKLIKDFTGENNTLKMPSKDIQHITKKALLYVSSDYDDVIKKYNKLPKNIKDNLALVFYSYDKELHTKYSHLKVLPGMDGRPLYRFYNP